MADNRKYIGGKTYRLKSTITSSDTSIVLSSFTNIGDDAEIVTADIGAKAYATIEPGGSKQEFISFTGVTQDSSNAEATLTGVTRGLDPNSTYAGSATFAKSHAGGSVLVISNGPGFYNDFANKENEETISQEWTFGTNPKTSAGDPTDDDHFARKSYVDAQSGGSTSKDRMVIAGNAGETVAAGDVVYLDTADQEWKKADADAVATAEDVEIGIAQGAGTDGAAITNGVLIAGLDSNQTGLTAGNTYYVSATAGAITSTAPTIKTAVGIAIDTTKILVERKGPSQPTGREKDAMAGGSNFGTPSSTNMFLTQDAQRDRKFGGDGSDGALSISSGTTTIDCGNASYVEKNYTSISITGTADLAFSNPATNGTIIVLKSQGDVTCTSSADPNIDVSNLGSGERVDGIANVGWVEAGDTTQTGGQNAPLRNSDATAIEGYIKSTGVVPLGVGAGGGDSSGGGVNGGQGAGALYIECAGALNFTGNIDAFGADGGTTGSGPGEGGGGGGTIIIVYNTLTASSGTYDVSGGAGGTGTSGSGSGGGASLVNVGSNGAGNNGGAGGNGISVIMAK